MGPRAPRSLWGLHLGSTQSWPQLRLNVCQLLVQDFIQQDSGMITQEIIKVCDMQAAQCIAQFVCSDEGTVAHCSQTFFGKMSYTAPNKGS